MKKLFVFALALVSLFSTSCSKDEETPKPELTPSELIFTGTLKSVNAEGVVFTQKNKVEFKIKNAGTASATLWMYKPQFTEKMPAMFDMEVPNITSKINDGRTDLSGESLVPHIGVKPYPSYVMTALKGTISADKTKLVIEFKCIDHTVTYAGDLEK